MSKRGKEITLPLKNASGRCVGMCGEKGQFTHSSMTWSFLKKRKKMNMGWLFTHLTFIMYYKPGSIQITGVAQTKTNMFLPSKNEQPGVKGKLLALRL